MGNYVCGVVAPGIVCEGGIARGRRSCERWRRERFVGAEQRAEGEGIVVMLRGIGGFVRVCCFHAGVGAKEFIARIKIMC